MCALASTALLSACASAPSAPEAAAPTVAAAEPAVKSAEDARTKAAEAVAGGDENQALYYYVQATTLDPTDSDSLLKMAAIYERHGDFAQAARAYAAFVGMEPDYALGLQGLGLAQFELRELGAARESLGRAVALDATLWRAHNALGLIADLEGSYAAAASHYSKAVELQPQMALLYNNRGYSSYLAGALLDAERDFRAAITLDADYEKAWKNLSLVHARQRNYEAALRALARVMSKPVAANDIGYVAMLDGDYAAAEWLFQEAIRLSPRYYPRAVENLAELRRRRGGEILAQDR